MREVNEQELKEIERHGGKVRRPRRPAAPKEEPRPEPVQVAPSQPPPPAPPLQPSTDPALMEVLIKSNADQAAKSQALLQSFGEKLEAAIHARVPVPWTAKVIRNDKGFIDEIQFDPRS